MTTSPQLIASFAILAVFLLTAGLVLVDDDALRDESAASGSKSYSLARVQLWWWTVLILGSWILVYGLTKSLWKLDGTCLTLLGISSVTTGAGRVIDNREQKRAASGGLRHQNRTSEGFFVDILSDEHGVSVHRFQSVAFNVMFGVAFLIDLFTNISAKKFPDFDPQTLSMLGLSSATYVALKGLENKPPAAPNAPTAKAAAAAKPKPASDELVDADEPLVDDEHN